MPRKGPSVRSLLMSTRVQPPYVAEPTRAELLAAFAEIRRLGATGSHSVWDIPRAILQRDEDARLWRERRDALRSCILSHDLKATPLTANNALGRCHCATCGRWRAELRAMHEDKAAKT